MNYMTKESIMKRLQEHFDIAEKANLGEVFAIFLQGSQNYIDDLYFEGSDVDSRAIYLPSVKDIYIQKDISKPEVILENQEHIDRFDIRKFLSLILTPGINNYECLFTEYAIINPKYKLFYNKIISVREKIVRVNEKKFLMATMGLSKRDLMNLERRVGGEDYDIKTFGYSRKRLCNIMRFNLTAKAYIANQDFSACLKAMDQDLINKVRRTCYHTLDEAREIAKTADLETKNIADSFVKREVDIETIELLQDIITDLMIASNREELESRL